MLTDSLPRIVLAHLPTPLEELSRLRAVLQSDLPGRPVPQLLIKRDDQTGLAAGGNKTRKLEYLVADAIQQGSDILITAGAPQSNHCRQTAAAAAKVGLQAILVLGGSAPMLEGGNLFLDRLLGAEIIWSGQRDRVEVMAQIAGRQRAKGHRPYIVPYGGSNAIGAVAYAAAIEELTGQLAAIGRTAQHIVVASSSGGTQAGLVVGARALGLRQGQIHGISIDREAAQYKPDLARLANAAAERLGLDLRFQPDDFSVNDAYVGAGYGRVGPLERDAIQLLARTEGLLVDPVYTGRALGGLIDLIHQGRFSDEDTVVFWHTGGLPALFAYADDL